MKWSHRCLRATSPAGTAGHVTAKGVAGDDQGAPATTHSAVPLDGHPTVVVPSEVTKQMYRPSSSSNGFAMCGKIV